MCDMNERLSRMMRTFGPGIMFASTAIGVSHLVQSTRAGAEFGWSSGDCTFGHFEISIF